MEGMEAIVVVWLKPEQTQGLYLFMLMLCTKGAK